MPETNSQHIYLAGFMGSGKTTVGPLLATILGLGFVDLDARIENQAGRRIREIFENQGEAAFRALESQALAQVSREPAAVVALGGGALLSEVNRATVRNSGISIYLRATIDTLAERLEPQSASRPVLGQGRALAWPELKERVSELLSLRSPLYGLCDCTVDTDGLLPEQVAKKIAADLLERDQG